MHSTAFVLLPPENLPMIAAEIRAKTKALLAPYHIELEVPPYKNYFSEAQISHWAEKFKTPDLQKIASHFTNDSGFKVDVDENGFYEITTFNPRGRFDYWGAKKLFEEDFVPLPEGEDLGRSLCRVSQLPKGKQWIPYSIITPEGEWFCAKDFGVIPLYDFTGRSHLNREADARWEDEARKILAKYSDHVVFALDVHS